MGNVIARMKIDGKNFEILVDVDKALEFRKTKQGSISEVLAIDTIFTDSKKGMHASEADIQGAFGTDEVNKVAERIIVNGDVQVPVEYKEKEREGKVKQVIDFLVRNAVDPQTDRPYTGERVERALKEAGVNITNKPIESQINDILDKLRPILPIKIETKRLAMTVPAQYTGQAYGVLNTYKESEEWMNNGDLKVIVNVPIGLQSEFYEKINGVTHGSVLSEEIKE